MAKDFEKFTYDWAMANCNIIDDYYDGNTRIVIFDDCIQPSRGLEKKIILDPETGLIQDIQF